MTGLAERPPKALAWLDAPATKASTTLLALVAILAAIFLGFEQQQYVSCIADQQRADQRRTSAIAAATDRERAAQRQLISAAGNGDGLRDAVLRAYDSTDQVRAENPPPPAGSC